MIRAPAIECVGGRRHARGWEVLVEQQSTWTKKHASSCWLRSVLGRSDHCWACPAFCIMSAAAAHLLSCASERLLLHCSLWQGTRGRKQPAVSGSSCGKGLHATSAQPNLPAPTLSHHSSHPSLSGALPGATASASLASPRHTHVRLSYCMQSQWSVDARSPRAQQAALFFRQCRAGLVFKVW